MSVLTSLDRSLRAAAHKGDREVTRAKMFCFMSATKTK
jgi:hypothetical protein